MLANIGGHGGAGTMKAKAALQFVTQQRKIKWLAVRQKLLNKVLGSLRPSFFVVTARGREPETRAVF